jgi:hypothetical protein
MRNSFAHRGGFTLMRTLSERERASKRRTGLIVALLALALGAGLFGALTSPSGQVAGRVYTSPLSYITVQ